MSEQEKRFLEVVDLRKGFGEGDTRQEVLRGVDFTVAKGEFCVLLGPSGSGKSTLLNIIGGIDRCDGGYISISGEKLADLNEKSLTMLEIDDLLRTLGLYEHRYKLPNQLSGGQQQRVSIGRAIVKNPDILLCDEPTGALDYTTSKEILKLIEDINRKYGNTVIMVTHNVAIRRMADHVIRLRDGRVLQEEHNDSRISATELDW